MRKLIARWKDVRGAQLSMDVWEAFGKLATRSGCLGVLIRTFLIISVKVDGKSDSSQVYTWMDPHGHITHACVHLETTLRQIGDDSA